MSDNGNGRETYSKLVLQQLETMANGIEGLRSELQVVKEQLSELKQKCTSSNHCRVKFNALLLTLDKRFVLHPNIYLGLLQVLNPWVYLLAFHHE